MIEGVRRLTVLCALCAACFLMAVPVRAQEEEIARADSLAASAEEMSGAGNYAGVIRPETGREFKSEYPDSLYRKVAGELLPGDEIFVQFRDVFTYGGNYAGKYEYAAITVDPEDNDSEVLFLFASDDLYAYKREDILSPELGNLVWGPLEEKIKGKDKIYFSVSGELANYPVEYLQCPGNQELRMNERYQMYRLSGIDQLARTDSVKTDRRKAAVFGGLEYGTDVSADSVGQQLSFRQYMAGLPSLPQTRKEASYIDSLLRCRNVLVSLQTGKLGGKTAFGEVAGSDVSMLHMATHGFYDSRHCQEGENRLEKWMMSRTGICLAGDYTPSSTPAEKGIVTGRDISLMNMGNLDLVVLSACQTALGDVFEGKRYGLSAAFKDAEAKSVLSSLWSVHDEATKLFMVRFYSDLTKGMDKCGAVRDAQTFLRDYGGKGKSGEAETKPFADPLYWAAFVMEDANKGPERPVSRDALDFIRYFQEANLVYPYSNQDIADWRKYGNLLQKDDALVYFYNYTLPSGEDEYAALVFSREIPDGTLIPVFRSGEHFAGEDRWQSVSDTVYARVGELIGGCRRFFFRPSGLINFTPVESFWESSRPEKSFYRIFSGESLAMLSEEVSRPASALLVGGLDYDHGKSAEDIRPDRTGPAPPGIGGFRFPALPASKHEVEAIDSILQSAGCRTGLLEGGGASEKVFGRTLAGGGYDIVHMASHGDNFGLKEVLESAYGPLGARHPLRETLLQCSVIPLSGADIFFDGTSGTDSDNMLTALEVTALDLKNTELVVLSTSRSLFSASTSSRNFGMAYAFKQAGAKSVMASTGNLDDTATSLFMTEFYRQWISGRSKHDALRTAREYVRTVEDGKYHESKYWAPFVILDALN